MNNNEYILNQEIKNRRILLKMYNKQAFKIKMQLFEAYEAKRSTRYLESLLASINKEIEILDKFFKEYAKKQTLESYVNGVKQADYGFKQLATFEGLTTSAVAFGAANKEAIRVLARETYIPLSKLTKTMARDCREYLKRENFETTENALKQLNKLVDSKTLRKIGIEGVSDVVVGNKTWQQGMRNIKEEFLRQSDFKVPYYKKDGTLCRLVPIEEYAKMVARTTTSHILREGAKDRIMDTYGDDGDLVEIIGHSVFPNSPCIPYEGKILSISGATPKELTDKLGSDYMGTFDEAEKNGLFHPNCIHTFGVSDRIKDLYNSQYDMEEIKRVIEEQKGNKVVAKNATTVNHIVDDNKKVGNINFNTDNIFPKFTEKNINNINNLLKQNNITNIGIDDNKPIVFKQKAISRNLDKHKELKKENYLFLLNAALYNTVEINNGKKAGYIELLGDIDEKHYSSVVIDTEDEKNILAIVHVHKKKKRKRKKK